MATITVTPGRPIRRRLGWFRSWRVGVLGACAIVALALVALLAPVLPIPDPLVQATVSLQGPSADHLLGTDELGRDILARIIYSFRLSLLVAVASAALAAVVGVSIGLVAGYFGGWMDASLMRLMDVLLSVPAMLLAVVLVAVLGSGAGPLIVAIAVVGLAPFARLTRASVLTVREQAFVTAQRAAGAPTHDLMLRTVLPNVLGSASVQVVVTASIAVLTESGLSFLGLGASPPTPSLGAMLAAGNQNLYAAPSYSIAVGLAIVLMVASFDAFGRGLQRQFGGMATRGGVVG